MMNHGHDTQTNEKGRTLEASDLLYGSITSGLGLDFDFDKERRSGLPLLSENNRAFPILASGYYTKSVINSYGASPSTKEMRHDYPPPPY